MEHRNIGGRPEQDSRRNNGQGREWDIIDTNSLEIPEEGELIGSVSVVDRSFDHPLETEEAAVGPLAGGIVQRGYQCDILWGATLAAGVQAYHALGPGSQVESRAVVAAQ